MSIKLLLLLGLIYKTKMLHCRHTRKKYNIMLYRNVANETIINVHVTNVIPISLIDSAELL